MKSLSFEALPGTALALVGPSGAGKSTIMGLIAPPSRRGHIQPRQLVGSLIQKGLEALLPGRTTFVIAHRLSTVRSCHQILVLDKGEAIERGTYDDLLRLGGRYSAMLEQQMMNHGPAPAADRIAY